jgi:uncharacterized protein (DUF1800 family)
MTKPPVVYTAGLLRATGSGITDDGWAWLNGLAGQQLFYPPNVSGWNDERWLDTATYLARWHIAGRVLRPLVLDTRKDKAPMDADKLVARALAFWGNPTMTPATRRSLNRFAKSSLGAAKSKWKQEQFPILTENALRHLIAASPDLQTS